MTRTTAIRSFLVASPLAFAALLTKHPMGTGDFYTEVAADVDDWLVVHYGGAFFFPLMALVIWLLIRGISGRPATIARIALPIYAVAYTVWETIFGIANGLIARSGNGLDGAERRGAADAVGDIYDSPIWGDGGVVSSVGALAWVTAVIAAIVALRRAGAGTASLVLLALGTLTAFHVPPIGPVALACLSAAAFLLERRTCNALAHGTRTGGDLAAARAGN